MADPTNKFAKALKQVSSKRAKTDSDYERMAEIEFKASLYMSPSGPVLPSFVVDAVLVAAAKKSRDGNDAKAGLFCAENAALQYDGPRTADELWADESFRYMAIVRVGTARVARCRPVFNNWTAVVKVSVETGVVNPARVDAWMEYAGKYIGLGDGQFVAVKAGGLQEPADRRPLHGRFQAQRL